MSTVDVGTRVTHQKAFRDRYTFEKRRQKATAFIAISGDDRVPVVIEPYSRKKLPFAHTSVIWRCLRDNTVCHLMRHIAKRIAFVRDPLYVTDDTGLAARETITCFIMQEGKPPMLPTTTSSINELYEKYADPDGFLYVMYDIQDSFGG